MRAREGAVRASIALGLVVALGYELVRTAHLLGLTPPQHLIDYLSYFTTLSNVVAAATLGIGAVVALRTDRDPSWYGRLVVATIAYTMTTFAVYNLSLRAVSTAPDSWANEVLHVVGPLYIAVSWAVSSRRGAVDWRSIRYILGLPVAWLTYTMLRGTIIGWYPYDFLNPAQPGGLVPVVGCVCLATGFIMVFALAAISITRVRRSRLVEMQRDGGEQLIGAWSSLGTEHLAAASRVNQQSWRGTDAVGLRLRLAADDVPLGRVQGGHEPLGLRHGPPRRRARRTERRRVEHEIHAYLNARRGAGVPARPR